MKYLHPLTKTLLKILTLYQILDNAISCTCTMSNQYVYLYLQKYKVFLTIFIFNYIYTKTFLTVHGKYSTLHNKNNI